MVTLNDMDKSTKNFFKKEHRAFIDSVWQYYHTYRRDFLPWRNTDDPYRIVVSELMLQQTQVARVIPKYHLFLEKFPDTKQLAESSLATVLTLWQGLGYNRRAILLHECAKMVDSSYHGV